MRKLLLIGLLLTAPVVHAAMNATTMWTVFPTNGDDRNGCGWDAASAGVNKSTWTPVSLSGLTSAGAGSTILYSGAASSDIGNIVNITGGTNFTTGKFRITGASAGTSWTTDRAVTTGVGALGTGFAFGPCKSLLSLTTTYVAGNVIQVKNESTIVLTSSLTFSASTIPNGGPPTRIECYTSTPGDGGICTVQMSASMTQPAVAFNFTGGGHMIEGFIIDCNHVIPSTGIIAASNYNHIYGNKVTSCYSTDILASGGTGVISENEITDSSGTTAALYIQAAAGWVVERNNIHHNGFSPNLVHGISSTYGNTYRFNLLSYNTGDGIAATSSGGYGANAINNIMYKNGRGCFTGGAYASESVWGNICDQSGSYGIKANGSAGQPADLQYDGNAFYGNPTNRVNMDDVSTNKQNAIGAYINKYDVVLSTDPFVDPEHGDFRLNASAGAMFSGIPQTFYGLNFRAYPSFGAVQPGPMPRASVQ